MIFDQTPEPQLEAIQGICGPYRVAKENAALADRKLAGTTLADGLGRRKLKVLMTMWAAQQRLNALKSVEGCDHQFFTFLYRGIK